MRLVAVLLGLVLVEVGYRVVLSVRGRPHDAEQVRQKLLDYAAEDGEVDDDPRRSWRKPDHLLHPYLAFSIPSLHERHVGLRHLVDRLPDTFIVVVFGGSVAQSTYYSQHANFARTLEEHPLFEGRKVHVSVLAVAGHKQPQQLIHLAYLYSLGVSPDVVINLDGFNELAVGGANLAAGVHPAFPSFAHYAHQAVASSREREALEVVSSITAHEYVLAAGARLALRLGVEHSSVATAVAMSVLGEQAGAVEAGFARYQALLERQPAVPGGDVPNDTAQVVGPLPPDGFRDPLGTLVDIWETASVNMDALARAHGAFYLHCLQPTLYDEGSKPLTEEEKAHRVEGSLWEKSARLGYPLLRERGRALSERGIEFFDSSQVFADVTDTLYFDQCHFVEKGQKILADAIAAHLLERLEAREWAARPVSASTAPR